MARFGELSADSQPHLDHLASCGACRDEIGCDRAMVQQLRTALAERVAAMAPSPDAWERILRRTMDPEPATARLWTWSASLLARLRTATTVAATGLALVLALNMEVVPVAIPSASEREAATASLQQGPRVDAEGATPAPLGGQGSGAGSAVQEREGLVQQRGGPQEPERRFQHFEGLMTQVDATLVARPAFVPDEPPDDATVIRVRFRNVVLPEDAYAQQPRPEDPPLTFEEPGVETVVSQAAEPS